MPKAAISAFNVVVQIGTKALMTVGLGKSAAYAVAKFAATSAVFSAVSVATTAILAPKIGGGGSPLNLQDSLDAGVPYVAGRRAVNGTLQHADEFGADDRYMGFVKVVSGAGPVDALESVRANNDTVTLDGSGKATAPEIYKDKFWFRYQLGAQPESAQLTQPGLYQSAAMSGWSSSEKLSGKAAYILTLEQDSKTKSYPAGAPQVETILRGIKWYDPRLDSTYPGGSGSCRLGDQSTYVYSVNGAIHALGYALGLLENGKIVEGFGCSAASLDIQSYVEAANVADLNNWTCNAYWTSADDPWEVYLAFLQAAGASPLIKWGKMSCVSRGAVRVSLTTISAKDTAAGVSIQPLAGRRDRINTVTPRCPLESHNWTEPDQTPVKVQTLIDDEDSGEERQRAVPYPFVTNEGNTNQAAQLAAYDIMDSREGMTGIIPVRPHLMDLEPGDCFTVTEPGFNLTSQKFLVHKRSFDFETGVSVLHVVSETDGKHAFAMGQSTDAPDAPTLSVPDPTEVPAPAVSVWTAVAGTGDQPNLVVTGATDNATATHVRLEYRLTTPSGGGSWPDDDTGWVIYDDFPIETESITVTGLEPNTSYQVAVSYISAFGVPGTRRIIATLSTGTLNAGAVGGLNRDAIEAADAAIAQAAAAAQTAADNAQTAAADVQAGIDAGLDVIDASAGDFAAAMATLRDSFATGHASVDEAVAARLALIDNTASSLAGDIQAQVRDTRDALAIAARTAMAVQAQIEQNQVLEESVGNFSAGFSSRIAVILSDVAALTTQVDAWTAVNVTGDITAALNAEINARVSGDDAQASRSDSIETTANDAQQKADSILALTYSPSSAIALKFSGIEQNVGALQTQYTDIINLENLGGSALLNMLESFEADLDPANPDSFRAAFEDARQIQIDDNAARTREIRDTRAEVARAALFIRSLRESTLFENEAALRLIEEANLAIAGNTASFQSILDMTLSPTSALVLRFEGIELDLDETEAGSLAAQVADHEYALFDGVAGLAGRMSTVETSLNPGSSGSLAAQVADLQSTRLTDNAATARDIRNLWAATARSNVAFQAQVEAIASENENTLRIIETAQVSADQANTRVDYILDLSIVDGTSLGNRLDSIEATANDAATQVSLDEAVQVQASDNVAVLRALRDVQAIAARTSIGFRAHLEARASSEEGILAEIETFRVETSKGLAQLETTKITAVDLEDAFAGFGLSLSSTFNIPTRFDAVEDELNPATPGSTANLAVNAATQADIDSSLVNWQLAINSSTRTIAGHLNHIEDDVDAVTTDLDQNYLTTAEANSAFTTMSEVETALATWQVSVNASTRTIADHLNHIEDTADATAADLAANYYTEAEADQAFLAESDLESALAAWEVSVNASTRTIADHLNHIEDQADNTAASLANDYLTASEANLAFMTESEVDNALASWAISVGATTQDIAAWITEHAAAITTLEGGGSAVYSLTLDVNGHISGLYATNDGSTSSIVWATDEFIIGDGLDTTAPFRFDTGTGTFQAQNFEVDFALLRNVVIGAAEIEDASITSLKMANGSVGVELEADRRDNELWYSGTISNPTTTSQFRIFTEYTDWADVKPGDALRLELDYMIEATIGSFEWLLFEDELEFQFKYEDGSTAFYSPDSAVSKRRFGAADNTGGGPNISGVRPSNDHRSIARIKIGTPTSTPWMQAGSHSPLKRVRARYFIRTRGGNATTTCIYGGNYNGAAVRTGLKLVYAECLLTKTVSGPIQT